MALRVSILLTADTHFDHGKVAQMRGFSSTREHDEWIVRRWNKYVRPDDEVFHLGDISIGRYERAKPWVDQLNGTKHLVLGNHDYHPGIRRPNARKFAELSEDWETIHESAILRYRGAKFLLSHFPYEGDRDEIRFAQYRLRDLGEPLVHGHTHSMERVSWSSEGTPMVCVSWDAWGRPAFLSEVAFLVAGV